MTREECLPLLTPLAQVVAAEYEAIRAPAVAEHEVDQGIRRITLAVVDFFNACSTEVDHGKDHGHAA